MKYSSHILSQLTATLLKSQNVKHIVISPGSRNAPLTIGFTHDSFFECYSIVDERSAGFFALGIAQQVNHPVALLCTSGSALLNYYPAIAEAYYSEIPLLVLSADRPKQFIGIGDGQTINQEGVFKSHVLFEANLNEHNIESNNRLINQALKISIQNKGPIHINIPFNEPLYGIENSLSVIPKTLEIQTPTFPSVDLSRYKYEWEKSKKKLVIIGVGAPGLLNPAMIDSLATDPSVLVMTETTSNTHHPKFIYGIDNLIVPLNNDEFENLKPEIVVTIGGLIVSKKIKAFLRQFKPNQHWHVGYTRANDTFFVLDKRFTLSLDEFFNSFIKSFDISTASNYESTWLNVFKYRESRHNEYLSSLDFCDLKVYEILIKNLPQNINLQLSNSTSVRYTQLFNLDSSIKVFCNRGTSGIDGSTSSAIGAATVNKDQTIFITGDLSFFYDSNAFWNNYIPASFRVIIVNNSGGGIFRILPGNKGADYYDIFFETTHNLNASNLCEMHGVGYQSASSTNELKEKLQHFFQPSNTPMLLEIFTPKDLNDYYLLEYLKFLS